jgi:hypothetical protein
MVGDLYMTAQSRLATRRTPSAICGDFASRCRNQHKRRMSPRVSRIELGLPGCRPAQTLLGNHRRTRGPVNGPGHYTKAEDLADDAEEMLLVGDPMTAAVLATVALMHATFASAAVVAIGGRRGEEREVDRRRRDQPSVRQGRQADALQHGDGRGVAQMIQVLPEGPVADHTRACERSEHQGPGLLRIRRRTRTAPRIDID